MKIKMHIFAHNLLKQPSNEPLKQLSDEAGWEDLRRKVLRYASGQTGGRRLGADTTFAYTATPLPLPKMAQPVPRFGLLLTVIRLPLGPLLIFSKCPLDPPATGSPIFGI
jgi:hypothetical protein